MSDERTFEPTPRRLERAQAEGDVARSPEGIAVAAFAGAAAALSLTLTSMLAAARALIVGSIASRRIDPAPAAELLLCAASVPLAGACAAVLCALLQGRFAVRPAALAARIERLDPIEGLRRVLSRDAPVHALRWLVLCAAIALCGLHALRGAVGSDLGGDPQRAIDAARRVCAALCVPAIVLGAAGGTLEYLTAARARLRRLRMSRDDVRRELRESDGDPHRKARRARMRASMRKGGVAAVREATVLLVNPTHVAVALRYDAQRAPVPVVVSKGAGERAAALRALARRYEVPIVEEVALARLLFSGTEVGRAIPESAFAAVAVVIAAIMRRADAAEGGA